MRILVAQTYVPFLTESNAQLADALQRALRAQDHQVDLIRIPFNSVAERVPAQLLGLRVLDLSRAAVGPTDQIIVLDLPAAALRHPRKIAWLPSTDHGDDPLADLDDLPRTEDTRAFRRGLIRLHAQHLRECTRIYTTSQTAARNLATNFKVNVTGVHYLPFFADERSVPEMPGDYLVVADSTSRRARTALALDAVSRMHASIPLVITGFTALSTHLEDLRAQAARLGIADRVQFKECTSTSERISLLANARAVICLAREDEHEDEVITRVLRAGTPFVTVFDAARAAELVARGSAVQSVTPTADALASALDTLAASDYPGTPTNPVAAAKEASSLPAWTNIVKELTG